MAQVISENADPLMQVSLDRLRSEFIIVFFWCIREHFVEVRVLLESQTLFFILGSAKVPQNFVQVRALTELLWCKVQRL